jgi:transcriptional regulator with XRE-family HTH domain
MMKGEFRLDTVGDLIREQRSARQLSQFALAKLAGIDQSKLSRIEANRTRQPDPQDLGAIADVLGVNVGLYYAAAGYPLPYRHVFPDPRDFFRRQYDIEASANTLPQVRHLVEAEFRRYSERLSLLSQAAIDRENTLGFADLAPWPLASRSEVVLYEWFGLLHLLDRSLAHVAGVDELETSLLHGLPYGRQSEARRAA